MPVDPKMMGGMDGGMGVGPIGGGMPPAPPEGLEGPEESKEKVDIQGIKDLLQQAMDKLDGIGSEGADKGMPPIGPPPPSGGPERRPPLNLKKPF